MGGHNVIDQSISQHVV